MLRVVRWPSLESAVGNYTTVASFLVDYGALLAAAPMKTLGSDVIFTFFERRGTIMNQYTSTIFKDRTPEERQAFSYFHTYVRRIDGNFIVGDGNRHLQEFDEYGEPAVVTRAAQLCGRTVVIGPTNLCLFTKPESNVLSLHCWGLRLDMIESCFGRHLCGPAARDGRTLRPLNDVKQEWEFSVAPTILSVG